MTHDQELAAGEGEGLTMSSIIRTYRFMGETVHVLADGRTVVEGSLGLLLRDADMRPLRRIASLEEVAA